MSKLKPDESALIIIDVQKKLMPAIQDGDTVISNCRKLIEAAQFLDVPTMATEQYPKGLGETVEDLLHSGIEVHIKTTFDGMLNPNILGAVPEKRTLVVAGCEAHVCVMQSVLGLLESGSHVAIVQDAIGSRTHENKRVAIDRMARHGADIVTLEMVLFEWLESSENSCFKQVLQMVR